MWRGRGQNGDPKTILCTRIWTEELEGTVTDFVLHNTNANLVSYYHLHPHTRHSIFVLCDLVLADFGYYGHPPTSTPKLLLDTVSDGHTFQKVYSVGNSPEQIG